MHCSDKNIISLFTESMIVPDYQRPFAWDKNQIDDFFSDLIKFHNRDDPNSDDFYLFGQIIIHKDNGTRNIVDGQQRMTTSTIFLCVLRDYAYENCPDQCLLTQINNAIGFDEDDGFKLTLGKVNREFFYSFVQCRNHETKADGSSNRRIRNAYYQLHSLTDSFVRSLPDSKTALKGLTNTFLRKFYVSYVETAKLGQASIIFETLNSRGMPLEIQDLLKNFFFGRIGDKWPFIKDKWSDMVTYISDADGDVSQYIKYYLNSYRPFVREKDVFGEVSKIEVTDEIKRLFDGITSYYKLYVALLSPAESSFGESSKESLERLKTMKATSFYPLIMAMRSKDASDTDIQRVLGRVECLIFRNQTVMKKTANNNERFFSNLAYGFSSGSETVESILDKITDDIVSDGEMGSAFKTLTPNSKVARMILTTLYNHDHPELRIGSSRKVHVEHIMPQSKGEWDVDDDVWTEYMPRLGNMVLLDGQKNISASNDLFSEKRARYRESSIDDTCAIADFEDWTSESIDLRQKELFDRVLVCWPKAVD